MPVTLRTVARAAVAHWFFGNLYEEVVGIPARYHLPMAPVTIGSVIALAAVERSRPTVVAAGCAVAGAALTGPLVKTVTLDLLSGRVTDPAERARLVATWHRANRVRLALVGAAAVALGRP